VAADGVCCELLSDLTITLTAALDQRVLSILESKVSVESFAKALNI